KDIIHYLFSVPKTGSFTLTISFLTLFLYKYVDIHKKDEFLDLLLTVISAFHPPTYVHSLTMASINRSLTKHLLKKHPELYIGFNNYKNIDEVKKHKKDILDFAYRSALCHDIGKIYVLEFIMTYGRSLYKEEFSLIMKHPEVGAYILSQHEETKAYQNIAKYHHRYFNETSGYPEESYKDLEEAIFIDTACVADCIDAATDSIGRSYKTAKSFKEIVSEMKDYSGTRYAPYVVDLFNDPIAYQEIESILKHERNENYAKVYDIVKKNVQSEE
ncbi:MAG: HD domain-containing protein, partial [Solobacterium sp.]|nr:HD domain-containing protein [Solobacterium sp.]